MNMESTYNYKRPASFTSLRSLLKQHIVRFVNENPDVFEAIARTGAPFGGNSLPTGQYTSGLQSAPTAQKELASIQQQLEVLNEQVARLTNTLNKAQSAPQAVEKPRNPSATPGKQIGIHRFWALQGKSQSMA